ncbi:5-azacytidine-induced protein 2 [Amia ocellicauda]|uniref:5-azacytidine-induced protein 2 n=1 Tax=Amia ocellicauda TaxID=2972642 RepID=UPI003463A5FD
MECLAVDDDICILKHETADSVLQQTQESPVSVSSGDESVASHFALVTAYEDIKKRLKEAEKENLFLRKRVKQLEDKLIKPDEISSDGPKYVNKAFSAYRGIYIEKNDLQLELDKVKKEKTESEKLLTEQLQAKELEVLQLRTELETSQVMKSMNQSQDFWDVYKVNHELKIHTLQQQLDIIKVQYSRLQEKCKDQPGNDLSNTEEKQECRDVALLKTYTDLRREMSNLYAVTKLQAEMVRKLRDNSQGAASRVSATVPVQCLEDVEKVKRTVPSFPYPSSHSYSESPALGFPTAAALSDEAGLRTSPRPAPVGSSAEQHHGSYGKSSLDENSWSFPNCPKPSTAQFWESTRNSPNPSAPKNPNTDWVRPY